MKNSSPQNKLDTVREKGKESLYYFSKYICGYSLMEEEPHVDLCNVLQDKKSLKKLILMPRGSFKSSVATISFPLHSLINDINLRILISSETFGQSKTFVSAIQDHIVKNEIFRALYGDLKGKSESLWRQDQIVVAGRTRVAREPSIMASGVGQTKVGLHFDIIILDDVVSNKNINTADQLKKTLDHYRLLLSILDPGGTLIIIGTRYSYDDLYGHIQENEADEFAIHKRAAIYPDGRLLFPERLTIDFLKSQKKAMGSSHFANQYMNEPIDAENAVFQAKWIKYFDKAPKRLHTYICVDPASSLEKDADFTGICVCGIDCDYNIYVLETKRLKVTIWDFIRELFDLVIRYQVFKGPGSVALETNAMQKTLKYYITEEQRKRKLFFPIDELNRGVVSGSKQSRIKALQPYFENGKIYLKENQISLIEEITRFPRTKHDDMVDSLSFVLEVMTAPNKEKEDEWKDTKLTNNEVKIWKEKEKVFKRRKVLRKKYVM